MSPPKMSSCKNPLTPLAKSVLLTKSPTQVVTLSGLVETSLPKAASTTCLAFNFSSSFLASIRSQAQIMLFAQRTESNFKSVPKSGSLGQIGHLLPIKGTPNSSAWYPLRWGRAIITRQIKKIRIHETLKFHPSNAVQLLVSQGQGPIRQKCA